jgi:iron complex outermembrane receptor protein
MTPKNLIRATPLAFAIATVLGTAAVPALAEEVASSSQLEEIVVTGQRREERLQEAAVAVNAFTAETLANANVTRPGDVLKLAPNVTFVQSNIPGEFYVTIRGNTQTRLGESSVALVVDGVQSLDQNGINQELMEIQQIEVLKGPQGALYGRNAIGGALVIVTKDPNFDAFEGKVKIGYGNGKEKTGRLSVSGPLAENFAVRAGVSYLDRDGFYKNNITGENVDRFRDTSGFLRAMWKPSDAIKGDFRVSATQMKGGGINWNAILVGVNAPVMSGDNTDLPYVNNIGGFSKNNRFNASMKWDFDLGAAKLISTSSFANLKDQYGSDSYPYFNDPGQFNVFFPGASPVGLGAQTQTTRRKSRILAQEIRIQSADDSAVRWMAGGYYGKFKIEQTNVTGADTDNVLLGLGPYPFGSRNQTLGYLNDKQDIKAWALFANLAYDIGPVELTASVRYDKEKREQTDRAFPGTPAAADPKQIPGWTVQAWRSRKANYSETQPKFSARWKATEDISVYASWGRGFKTGGFNPFGTGALLRQFNPASTVEDLFPKETADTWEIGIKTQLLDRRVTFNASYFETKSKNSQLLEFFPQATLQAVSTADKVKMKGFELELQARPIDGLDLIASYGDLDAKVTAFGAQPNYVGNKRPSTSPYTLLLGAQFSHALPLQDWEIVARGDFTRQGKTIWDWADTPGAYRSAFSLVNARLAVRNEQWEVAVWGKNLTDKRYNSEHIVLLPFAGALFRAAPRQYGVEVGYRF